MRYFKQEQLGRMKLSGKHLPTSVTPDGEGHHCANAPAAGQTLGYDALRRLLSWQNTDSSLMQTGSYAYIGGGERVWQQEWITSSDGGSCVLGCSPARCSARVSP